MVYKIITKLMVERLELIIYNIISIEKDGFVKGRKLIYVIIQIHETLNSMHKKKKPTMIVKLDMENTYDRVS